MGCHLGVTLGCPSHRAGRPVLLLLPVVASEAQEIFQA